MKKLTTLKIIGLMVLSSLATATFLYLAATPQQADAYTSLVNRLKGKILLRVEHKGEAWYVNPDNGQRYFMGSPTTAYNLMKSLGLGITDDDLFDIPLAQGNYDENSNKNYYTGHGISFNYPLNWTLDEYSTSLGVRPPNPQVEVNYFWLQWKTQTIESFVNEYNNPQVGSQISLVGTINLNGTIGYKYAGTSSLGPVQMILFTHGSTLYIVTYNNLPEVNEIINSITVL